MGKTAIEWCYTPLPDGRLLPGFSGNAWLGCSKVSAGCKNCYAESDTPARVRRAAGLEIWGAHAPRPEVKSFWVNLPRWNRQAQRLGVKLKHFCGSNCDIFEDRRDLDERRARLFPLLERCDDLIHILVTKRPENVLGMVPSRWTVRDTPHTSVPVGRRWPGHIWLLASVEDQQRADERIPQLLRCPALVLGVSYEPALEAVSFRRWLRPPGARYQCSGCGTFTTLDTGCYGYHAPDQDCNGLPCPGCGRKHYWTGSMHPGLSWLIYGGESGPGARPNELAWARAARDECQAARVAFFFKQAGREPQQSSEAAQHWGSLAGLTDKKGGNLAQIPVDLRVRQFPAVPHAL